jgi:hypothetical protein
LRGVLSSSSRQCAGFLNALEIAWVSLLRAEPITEENIDTAPRALVVAVLEAAIDGGGDAAHLAAKALKKWEEEIQETVTLH